MEKSVNTELSTTMCFTSADDQAIAELNNSTEKKELRLSFGFAVVKKPLRKFTFDSHFKNNKCRRTSHNFSSGTSLVPSIWVWKTHKSLIYGFSTKNPKQSNKIALFDMDGTIITNKKGRSHSEWEFFHPSVPQKLRELQEQGYRIALASNQQGISLNLVSETVLREKVQQFAAQLGVELTVMLATKADKFRKPETGMWYFLINNLNQMKVDLDQCVSYH